MPKHLLRLDPSAEHIPADRLAYLTAMAERLADYAVTHDERYADLCEQLNSETSKFERGFILGYVTYAKAHNQ